MTLLDSQHILDGVVMELCDCAFPLLKNVVTTDDPLVAFNMADIAILSGARLRMKGMERIFCSTANAEIFSIQGKALNEVAKRNVDTDCLATQPILMLILQ